MSDVGRRLVRRGLRWALGACLVLTAATVPAAEDWSWLVPFVDSAPALDPSQITQLPGSARRFSIAELRDLKHAVDWYPAAHPAAPAIVLEGHGNANACGYCHLPTGNGRPENSALAGLPADYIKRQLAALADGSRRSPAPNQVPTQLIAATAKSLSPEEIEQSAAYFSKLRFVPYVEVVESTDAEFVPGRFIYVRRPGVQQPIGTRIIEVPVDLPRFEQRDPQMRFLAYVPPRSIDSGRALATSGGPAGQPCAVCHGEGLRGGIAPPLAGRSPTMLIRQLAAFHEGTRSNAEAAPMRAIAAPLDVLMMISLAAYAGTLKP